MKELENDRQEYHRNSEHCDCRKASMKTWRIDGPPTRDRVPNYTDIAEIFDAAITKPRIS